MNNQEQFNQSINQKPKNSIWTVIVTIFVTVLIVGGSMYYWYEIISEKEKYQACEDQNIEQAFKTPDITFEVNPMKSIKIKNHGAQVGEITINKPLVPKIFKQTRDNVYIKIEPDGIGGYILYSIPTAAYKLNLSNNELTPIFGSIDNPMSSSDRGSVLLDISLDETKWLIRSNKYSEEGEPEEILFIVKDAETGSIIRQFKVPDKYKTAGVGLFSPNEKRISFAAAVGNPDAEEGAYFVGDIETGELKIISEVKGDFFNSGKWRSNENPYGKYDLYYNF